MPKMNGPAILLAQFMRDEKPYNNIENIATMGCRFGIQRRSNSDLGRAGH